MSLLNGIQRGLQSMPPRILVYGTEGIGKSTLAANAPGPIFIQTEDGLSEIACDKFPIATSFEDVMAALNELAASDHAYQTVAIDSLDWLERLIWDAVCKKYHADNIEKADGGYQRGYAHALTFWRSMLDALNRLRTSKHMAVILIAHAKVEKFDDPESAAYDRYSPRLHKHAAALIVEWCDAVLFATREFRTQQEDKGFNKKRTIAVGVGDGGGKRVLRTTGSPACMAKNRYDLPSTIDLLWSELSAHLFKKPLEKGTEAHG